MKLSATMPVDGKAGALLSSLIIMSALAVLLFSFLGIDAAIGLDEAYSAYAAGHGFGGIIADLKMDGGPPLYYFLLAIWIRAFGTSEVALRSLSVVTYILSLIAIYVVGKSVHDRKTGVLCMFLYTSSTLAIRHAQRARMYSLLVLLEVLSTLFFLRLFLIKTRSKKDLALYIIANILGTFTHYWFFFLILAQIASYVLLFSRASLGWFSVAILLSILPFSVLWTPILLLQMDNGCVSWLRKPDIYQLIYTLLNFYGGGSKASIVLPLLAYTAFLALILLRVEGFEVRLQSISALKDFIVQRQNLVFLISLFVLVLVPWIISQVKPIYYDRYTIIALFPFVMFIGSLLSKFGNKLLVWVCCCFLLAGVSTGFVIRQVNLPQHDRATTEYLIEHAERDDVLIFTSLSRLGIEYYLGQVEPNKTFIKITFPSEMALHPGWRDVKDMLGRKESLEREADSIVEQLDRLTRNDNKNIWLFYGSDIEIGEILKDRLDVHFSLMEELDLHGAKYESVLLYRR